MDKLTPFQNLRNIITEGEELILTKQGEDNLKKLLGITEEKKPKKTNPILDFFKKIDEKIFKSPSRKWNNKYHKINR